MKTPIVIGSRGSKLALWQANHVQHVLREHGLESTIHIIQTRGDRIQDLSFDKLEGKGFFTKEIEAALLDGTIDLAVHSHKDLETQQPEGLTVAAVTERADVRDVLVIREELVDSSQLWGLPLNAVVGTSSARRKGQLQNWRPDVQTADIRGNVPTRIRKLRDEKLDAIVLAKAGLDRLELVPERAVVVPLDPHQFVPAPAQGALAIQTRSDDAALIEALQVLHDAHSAHCVGLERAILAGLQGGCQLPFGAKADWDGKEYTLEVAHSPEVGGEVRMLHLRGTDAGDLAQKALGWLLEGMATTPQVYITRDAHQVDHLPQVLDRWDVPLETASQITIEPKPFQLPSDRTDWVFFSSRNAVDAFFAVAHISEGQRVGAIGPGTARKLARYTQVDFVGKGTETQQTASDFAQLAEGASVLFPIGNRSRRTVQESLNPSQVVEVEVYQTVMRGTPVGAPDIAVFTSPSNVEGFAQANAFPNEMRAIAAGQATEEALRERGVVPTQVLTSMSSTSITRAIFTEMLGL